MKKKKVLTYNYFNKGSLSIEVRGSYAPSNFPIEIKLPESRISIAEAKFIRDKLIKIL